MGLRRALLFLPMATGLVVANGQCGTLAFTGVVADNATICSGDSTLLVAEGIFPGTTALHWQLLVGTDWQPFGPDNDSVFVDPVGTTSFRCFADCGAVSDTSDAVEVEVVTVVLQINSLAPDTSCGAVNDTVVATGADTYLWLPTSSLTLVSIDTAISTATTTTTYTVTGTIGSCSVSDSITLHVIAAPFSAHGGDTIFCSGDPDASISFTFDGEGPWDVTINGPEGPYSETGNTSGSFTINNPAAGTYQVDTLITASCPNDPLNNGGPIEVTVTAPPGPATIDQAPATLCQNGTGLLVAFPPDAGSGVWSQTAGPLVQLVPASSVSVSFSPTEVGAYAFTWTVSNAPCALDSASVTVTVTPGAPLANAGPPITLCSGTDTTLQGNTPSPGSGTWTVVSAPTGSAPIFSDATNAHSVFTPDTAGEYLLRWTISNPPCDPSDSTVLITVLQSASSPLVLGLDDEPACDGEYQTLMIADPANAGPYSWHCDNWLPADLQGDEVVAHWTTSGAVVDTITITPSGPCQVAAVIPVALSADTASCPRGIVYFEPHGLAILDETAHYFQWGTIDADRHFVVDPGRTEQTTFVPGLTSCDSSQFAVRTSIYGDRCWSTTVSCATPEMLVRACLDLEEFTGGPQVRVFPNPSDGGPVTLEATGESGSLLNIDVSDLNGRIISRGTIRMNGMTRTAMELARLDRGIYVLRAWNTVIDQTIKLVIH